MSAQPIPVAHRPVCFAFFDVDETLIGIKSMFDFMPYWCHRQGMPDLRQRFDEAWRCAMGQGQPREHLNRLYYQFFEAATWSDLQDAGRAWFQQRFKDANPPYLAPVIAALKFHQAAGEVPVFVSGSMLPLLRPLADELGVTHCLCTQLVLDPQGRLTGDIGRPQTIGQGKAEALTGFLARQGAHAEHCHAYGDDISDLPMLEAVGMPVAVGTGTELAALAQARGWACLPT